MRSIVFGVVFALLVFVGHPVTATIPVPPNGVACDFVTGGGYIVGENSGTGPPETLAEGAKGNFGVGGGVRNGAFWGHLEYSDHSTNPPFKVHGTSVTGYFPGLTENSRTITGTADVTGVGNVDYTVEVTDNAEPGRGQDKFSIKVGAYTASGVIAGGNIQLHKPNASNTPPPDQSCSRP